MKVHGLSATKAAAVATLYDIAGYVPDPYTIVCSFWPLATVHGFTATSPLLCTASPNTRSVGTVLAGRLDDLKVPALRDPRQVPVPPPILVFPVRTAHMQSTTGWL